MCCSASRETDAEGETEGCCIKAVVHLNKNIFTYSCSHPAVVPNFFEYLSSTGYPMKNSLAVHLFNDIHYNLVRCFFMFLKKMSIMLTMDVLT